jgi:outer membrane cobalamin receptor
MVDLGTILLYRDITEDQDLSLITITDDELNDDASAADNISGLLQATKDIYLRTAAFEFSSSFFRIKGLDSGNGKVLINGVEMNKLFDGRAQWSNWGGLNDVLRNQEFSNGLSPSNFTFGGVLGATNINTRASEQRPRIRVS